MLIPFDEAGAVGILGGAPPHEVPPSAWTAGQNARMVDGAVHKFLGHQQVFNPPSVVPHWLLRTKTPTAYYWLYASLAKVYVTDGAAHFNITRQTASVDVDYNAATLRRWNGGVLGGIPILNNGIDDPQMWNPVGTGQRLQLLSNWPANTKAEIIRTFKSYLIALDITKSSTRYPYMVKWSHASDPGAVPSSWNEADPAVDAGESELAETTDFLVDCKTLRDFNVVYKEGTTWAMQHIGPPFIFRFSQLFGEFGLLTRDCAAEFFGKHFVVSRDDILIHDGQSAQSIFGRPERKKMAAALFGSIDTANINRCFVARLLSKSEVWFCYPESGATYCNKALVWNWRRDTIGLRDLPNVNFILDGTISEGASTTWDADSATWDSDTSIWDQAAYSAANAELLGAGTSDTRLYQFDATNQANGTSFTSYVERTQIPINDKRLGSAQRYFISEVWPRMTGTGSVNIYVGGQERVTSGVVWTGPFAFNPATDKRIMCSVNTPLPAIRFESTGDINWTLEGFGLSVVGSGRY